MKDNYVYAVARIRVKEKTLLTDADIASLAGMSDVNSVMGYLSDRGWGTADTDKDPDAMLAAEEQKNLDLMRELKIDPSVFDILSYPQIFHNLKSAIKQVCTAEDYSQIGIFYDLEKYGGREMVRIIQEKDYNALPESMRQVAQDAFETMLSTRDGQLCDIMVDRACLMAMTEAGRKEKNTVIRDYVRSQVSIADIRIAVRAERCGKSADFLKKALAPSEDFNCSQLAAAASRGEEDLLKFLSGNGFGGASEALGKSLSAFECWCDNQQIEAIKPQKRVITSIGPVVAYYLARENEIRTVRIILTAKANGFSEDSIRERVREMYV